MFQHRWYLPLTIFMNVGFPIIFANTRPRVK